MGRVSPEGLAERLLLPSEAVWVTALPSLPTQPPPGVLQQREPQRSCLLEPDGSVRRA